MEDLSFMIYREYLFLLQKDGDSDRYNSMDQWRPRRLWARNHVLESRSGTNVTDLTRMPRLAANGTVE